MINQTISAKGGSLPTGGHGASGAKKILIIFFALFLVVPAILFSQTALAATCASLKGNCQYAPMEGDSGTSCKSGTKAQEADDCKYSDGKECCVPTTGTSTSPTTGTTPGAAGGSTTPQTGGSVHLTNPLSGVGEGTQGVATVIGRVINLILGVVGSFALLMFVYGGFLMITSAGHSEQVKKGKDTLTWSVLGIAVILGSYVLASYVVSGFKGQVKPATIPGGTPGGVVADDSRCDAFGGTCTTIPVCTEPKIENGEPVLDADGNPVMVTMTDFSACLRQYLEANPTLTCQQNLCSGLANRVCCKDKTKDQD